MELNRQKIENILFEQASQCSCYIKLVEIVGRRISYICGRAPEAPLFTEIEEIKTGCRYKLLAQKNSGVFSEDELAKLKKTGEMIERYLP